MNEQDISNAVKAVLEGMNANGMLTMHKDMSVNVKRTR